MTLPAFAKSNYQVSSYFRPQETQQIKQFAASRGTTVSHVLKECFIEIYTREQAKENA